MFCEFFAALANLSAAVDALTATVQEARDNFCRNLGLDHQGEPEQLEHEPAQKGRRKKTTAN